MTTAGERLQSLSKLTGVAAASMLLAIGQGATAADALLSYSSLESATAAEHLLYEKVQGAGKSKRSRVIIGTREYFLTPQETADLLYQRAKSRADKQPDNVVVVKEKPATTQTENKQSPKQDGLEYQSDVLNLIANIQANHAFVARMREAFRQLEAAEIARQLEEDEEECLILLM